MVTVAKWPKLPKPVKVVQTKANKLSNRYGPSTGYYSSVVLAFFVSFSHLHFEVQNINLYKQQLSITTTIIIIIILVIILTIILFTVRKEIHFYRPVLAIILLCVLLVFIIKIMTINNEHSCNNYYHYHGCYH